MTFASDSSSRDLLRVEDLHITFPLLKGEIAAVRGASLRILPGKVTALVGESGSGKTVISQSILGLQTAAARVSGRILLDEGDGPKDLLSLPHDGRAIRSIRGNRIGMIFQEPMTSFSPLHTIGNQISEAVRIHKPLSKSEIYGRCIKMLGRVGFNDPEKVFEMYPFELSGGMRQRAMIAMALVCEPALLIADEPTTALDVTIQAQILLLLRELQEEMGMAILLITHDLGVVANIADEVVVLYHGQVMEAGPVDPIFRNPQHSYLKGLLGAIPDFEDGPDIRLKPLREIAIDKARDLRKIADNRIPGATEASDEPLLAVRHLSKTFSQRSERWSWGAGTETTAKAVDDVSFDIYRGECLGLVGESGSGKTTVGKMILRAVEPDEGTVHLSEPGSAPVDVLGASGDQLDRLRTRMQMIFQDPMSSLSPRMTVGTILTEPLDIHDRGNPDERLSTVSALLHSIGLGDSAVSRYPHSFSGGQRQRIGIARALALAPELIVCDEAVSALDVSVQAQVLNLLKDLQKELSLTYLFISHNLAVVNYMADRVAVMWRGQLVELAPSSVLMKTPAHPYTQALLRAVPHPDPDRPLDMAAAGTSAQAASETWPAAFCESANARLGLIDIGGGHMVRMRETANAREIAV
ncbi:MAG: ABC transporter ATP-binding protein [Pseudomonadota bacterium]